MSFLHKRESRINFATRPHIFPLPGRENKVCGFIEKIYKREKARIAGAIIISGIITEGLFSHSSRLQDFPNHFSIPVLHLSAIFLLLLLHKEILMLCLMEFYDDGFSL